MKIKICGITNIRDALAAIEAGADMLGFNFYPKSPRFITLPTCRSILNLLGDLRGFFVGVGVFVDSTPEAIRAVLEETGLPVAQLSGDEPADCLEALGAHGFKAMRLSRNGKGDQGADSHSSAGLIQQYSSYRSGSMPAVLVDSLVRGGYGGTGVAADWDQAAGLARQHPILLAGGLTANNVAEAISRVRPWGVDVASGVESEPGKKDTDKVRQFIYNARMAGEQLGI